MAVTHYFSVVQQAKSCLDCLILDVSTIHTIRHTHTPTHLNSFEQVISPPQRPLPNQHTQRDEKKIYALSGIQTRNPSNRTGAGLRLKLIYHERRCGPLLPLAPQLVSKCNGCTGGISKAHIVAQQNL
jgi:hypothetical protein